MTMNELHLSYAAQDDLADIILFADAEPEEME